MVSEKLKFAMAGMVFRESQSMVVGAWDGDKHMAMDQKAKREPWGKYYNLQRPT